TSSTGTWAKSVSTGSSRSRSAASSAVYSVNPDAEVNDEVPRILPAGTEIGHARQGSVVDHRRARAGRDASQPRLPAAAAARAAGGDRPIREDRSDARHGEPGQERWVRGAGAEHSAPGRAARGSPSDASHGR